MLYRHGQVTIAIPMQGTLKVFSSSSGYNCYPDEKGTESYRPAPLQLIPMKRGLKVTYDSCRPTSSLVTIAIPGD